MDRSEFSDLAMVYGRLREADEALSQMLAAWAAARKQLMGVRFAQPDWMTGLGRQVTRLMDERELIQAGEDIRSRMEETYRRLETAATQGKEQE